MSLSQLYAGSPRAREARDFRLMFYFTFGLFLTAGAVQRLLNPLLRDPRRKSLFAEARSAANTCVPFAFMR